jgi:predicted dehydrogenase
VVAFIGAGNYATRTLIPAFKETAAVLKSVASSGGVNGVYAGKKFGFQQTTTDTERLFANPSINTVVITTRHNSHAHFVCKALDADKHVFVEKPLCLTMEELETISRKREESISRTGTSPADHGRFQPAVRAACGESQRSFWTE